MIELRSSVSMRKPILALVDPDSSRGGLTQEQVFQQLVETDARYAKWGFDTDGPRGAELYAALFAREPIEWNRIGCFQNVTLRCIAERLLAEDHVDIFVPSEIVNKKPILPEPNATYHAYCSSSNEGARELMRELAGSLYVPFKVAAGETRSSSFSGLVSWAERAVDEVSHTVEEAVGASLQAAEEALSPGKRPSSPVASLAPSSPKSPARPRGSRGRRQRLRKWLGWAVQNEQAASAEVQVTTESAKLHECDYMLLYLTGKTWTSGEASAALADEVRAAMDAEVPILLAHEMIGVGGQEARAGCDFGNFFFFEAGATPPDLIQRGLYAKIAVALKGGEWRATSMVLLAQSLDTLTAEADLATVDKEEMQRTQGISKSMQQELGRVMRRSSSTGNTSLTNVRSKAAQLGRTMIAGATAVVHIEGFAPAAAPARSPARQAGESSDDSGGMQI